MSMQELFYGDRDPGAYLVHYGRQQFAPVLPIMQVPHSRSGQYTTVPRQRYSTQRYQSRPNNASYYVGLNHAARLIVNRSEDIETHDADRNGTRRVPSNGFQSTFTRICCPGITPVPATTLVWHPAPIATVTVVDPIVEEETSSWGMDSQYCMVSNI
jgi:hypothetical protein